MFYFYFLEHRFRKIVFVAISPADVSDRCVWFGICLAFNLSSGDFVSFEITTDRFKLSSSG